MTYASPQKKTTATESGVEVTAPISGAGLCSVCQGPKIVR